MKVAVIGGNGQLGVDILAAFKDVETLSLTHEDIEISDVDHVVSVLGGIKPSLVINTAAYHKVDDCEKNPDRSYEINSRGALNLAKTSESIGFELVHISTDYVFDGLKRKPYLESDRPNPLNVYAVTKLAGEYFVSSYATKHYIVRSSGLYGHNKCRAKGRNFIDTMMTAAKERPEVRVVQDEVLTPTYTYHLALQIRELVKTGAYGLYHATNNGECSWYEFAKAIFEFAGLSPNLKPTTVKDFPSPIKRPSYSVLQNAGLQSLNIDKMPHWRESLAHYFNG
ncbi:MAG: dTDP-4-dehydrorhamnose reductase [Bacteroidota bacterium]